MPFGNLKVGDLIYESSGSEVTVSLANLATKASPTFTGTVTGVNLTLSGNLTVNGTQTIINTQTLDVEDKQIEIGKVSSPSDTTADQGGWKLKGATDKTFLWVNATDAWTSSEHINLGDNKKLLVGTGSDLQIFHDGSNSYIDNNTGSLINDIEGTFQVKATDIYLYTNNNETAARAFANGGFELWYNGGKTFETTANGVTIYDDGKDDEARLIVQGGEANPASLYLYADDGDDNADKWRVAAESNGTFRVGNYSTGSWVYGLTLDSSNNAAFAGNVGIGTTSPAVRLEVQEEIDVSFSAANSIIVANNLLRLENNSTNSSAFAGIQFRTGTGGDGYFGSYQGSAANDCTFYWSNQTDGGAKVLAELATATDTFTVYGTVSDSKGDLRSIVQNHKTGAYTLIASDAGKMITITTGGVTVNNSIFSAGQAVSIINHSGSDQTITQGSSFTLHNTADATTGNRTLAGRGMATMWFSSHNEAYISGAGLS